MSLQISKESGSLVYLRRDKSLLLAERSYESRTLEEYDAFKTIEDEHALTESIVTADGVKQKIKYATKVFDKKLYRTRLHLDWQEDEFLFGLGQSPQGQYNLRGSCQYIHQANMKIAVPFLISSKGYGILLTTGGPALFQDTAYGSYLQTEADEEMDFYFLAGENYAEFKERGLLFPFSEIYNAFDEEARQLYWKQANEGLFAHGIDAWWCDSSEPTTPEWSMEEEPDPATLYRDYVKNVEDFNFLELGNAYGLYHSQGIYEGQRGACDKKRVVNLTRSGYTGQQKYGTILWNGDVAASWETMRKQIIAGLHLTACGLPYWTLDIGAFFVKRGKPWFWAGEYPAGTQDLAYRELYTRWFQYGAFLPVFRAHGTDIRREVWEFGKPGEIFYEALCEAIRLRYQLIPYIYSLAGAVYLKDETMMRFLAFEFPNDPEAMKVSNQYMFGPAFMVCPITGPMYYQVNSNPIEEKDFTHRVYLPAGINWYDFWTNRKYQGGRWVTITADISRIPLFIREGSIIPMTETMNYVEEKPRAEITLHVYPGCDGEFLYYDDEGDGYGYEEGEYRLIQLEWNEEQKILTEQLLNDYKKIERKRPLFVKAIEDSKKLI